MTFEIVHFGWVWGPASWVGIPFEIVDLGRVWGPTSWVGILFEIVDVKWLGAQLAESESHSKS